MKPFKTLILITSALSITMVAAADATFEEQLIRSGHIHTPLPLDTINSLEHVASLKPVLAEERLDMYDGWHVSGLGTMTKDRDNGIVELRYATFTGRRATGSPDDPDYATYGGASLSKWLDGQDLSGYNRLAFDIRPVAPGLRVANMNLSFNNGSAPQAGYNPPTGAHLINLKEGRWNRCYLEIADLQRDSMKNLDFYVTLNGRDQTTPDSIVYQIANLRLQKIAEPEKVSGWEPKENVIVYSMTGYDTRGRKTALVSESTALSNPNFTITADGRTVLSGKIKVQNKSLGRIGEIDFTEIKTPGIYEIKVGDLTSRPFRIGKEEIWDNSQWRVLNYIFGQRCGYDVPGIHGKCHTDLYAVHNGMKLPYSGGWHDAGDLSQQTFQTAEVAYALMRAANSVEKRNPALSARLREEARWGLDFALRTRFDDGYRASSMGLLIWQDGIQDSFDDLTTVRVQNLPVDNYTYAYIEAYAARIFEDDPGLAALLRRVAIEDFDYAEREFSRNGLGNWRTMMEHTYNTSMSQMMATIAWSASQLYVLTGNPRYANRARQAADYMLDCQQTEPLSKKNDLRGFFYRDRDHRVPVHYIHQSRDQIYMQALESLLATQPDSPDAKRWLEAARLYGSYVKGLMRYTAPYGMIPSGVYRDDEYKDNDSFEHLHLFAPDNAEDLYKLQFANGVKVAPHFSVRRFPIWFSIFNGNTAIHTSTGISAAIAGRMLDDPELSDIAREQLYWTVGKNPFAQSLIYGEGHNYPMMNSFSSGEITGEMPVGIRSLGNSDEPYWPQINNACYKEVWVTSAGKWLLLLSELAESDLTDRF